MQNAMKRKIIIGVTFITMTCLFNSCELGNCKICRQVTYDSSGSVIHEGQEAEYCDADLIAIELKEDIYVGGNRISWECR